MRNLLVEFFEEEKVSEFGVYFLRTKRVFSEYPKLNAVMV